MIVSIVIMIVIVIIVLVIVIEWDPWPTRETTLLSRPRAKRSMCIWYVQAIEKQTSTCYTIPMCIYIYIYIYTHRYCMC